MRTNNYSHWHLKSTFLLIGFMLFPHWLLAQEINQFTKQIEADKYYPENQFIRKNKIHLLIDSSEFNSPSKLRANEYDLSGRIIGEFDYKAETLNKPYSYKKNGHTLTRLKYNSIGAINSFEQFIYNSRGQILSYLECADYYFKAGQFTVTKDVFFYDDNGILESKSTYYKQYYTGKLSDKLLVKSSDLRLFDVVYYAYKTLKNGNNLIIGYHSLGPSEWRATDSTVFDKHHNLARFNSYAQIGSLGCQGGNNVNRIIEHKHYSSTLLITSYTTICDEPFSDSNCSKFKTLDEKKDSIIYNPQELPILKYSSLFEGAHYLSNVYSYIFYK